MNDSSEPSSRRPSRWLAMGVVIVVAVGLFWIGRGQVAEWYWTRAVASIERGELAEARSWVDRGAAVVAGSPRGPLLRARLARQRGNREDWEAAMALLDGLELTLGDGQALRLERRLGAIRWGEASSLTDNELDRLVDDGADVGDAAVTLLARWVESGELERAQTLLRQWELSSPPPAQLAWGQGLLQSAIGEHRLAIARFDEALAAAPGHDNARLGRAESAEQLREYGLAARSYAEHLRLWPDSETALLGLSRSARNRGNVELADELMDRAIERPPNRAEPSVEIWLEAAEVAFLQGDYEEAYRRFEQTDLEGPQRAITVRTAATASGLAGNPEQAEALFNRYLSGHHLTFRREAVESRVREDPSDQQAMAELRQILSGQYVPVGFPEQPESIVSPLFSRHCGACHGEGGRGDGRANRHLWPPARDLQGEPYRMVTTANRFPSRDDIRRVIRQGIPGTAMPAFAELSEEEIEQLVESAYQLRQAGVRQELVASFEAFDEPVDEEMIDEIMERRGTAGPTIEVPDWIPVDAERLATARSLFDTATCNRCHGEDGRGVTDLWLLDDRGRRTFPRDLVADPLKSGSGREALFLRVKLGMPGTPHPANPTLSDDELMALVDYCLSLGQEPKRQSTNYERSARAHRIGDGVGTMFGTSLPTAPAP